MSEETLINSSWGFIPAFYIKIEKYATWETRFAKFSTVVMYNDPLIYSSFAQFW